MLKLLWYDIFNKIYLAKEFNVDSEKKKYKSTKLKDLNHSVGVEINFTLSEFMKIIHTNVLLIFMFIVTSSNGSVNNPKISYSLWA